jgi:acyl carrier protein
VTLDANKTTNCPTAATASADVSSIVRELATLITQAINLEIAPDQIDPDAPLYGEGLGLDSIDILEVALVVAKRYNIQLKAESEENHVIFASLRNLAQYVATHTAPVDSPRA